jgi:hypothetical protein
VPWDRSKLKESDIHPSILYNDKVELIKASEFLVGVPPEGIAFKILENSAASDKNCKTLRLASES